MDEGLNQFARTVWSVVGAAAGLGVIIAAVFQILQDLLPLRRLSQEWQVPRLLRRLARRGGAPPLPTTSSGPTAEDRAALADLINLAAAGNAEDLFNLPTDLLAGQFGIAAQIVLDYPPDHGPLLRVLASGAKPEDIATLLSTRPSAPAVAAGEGATGGAAAIPGEAISYVDARNRVAHQIQRNLDALQIHLRYWLEVTQLVSTVAIGLVAAALFYADALGRNLSTNLRQWVVIGVTAGFFASTLKNVLTALRVPRGAR